MLHRRRGIAVKLETTYRTDSVPTAALNAMRIDDLNWSFTDVRRGTRTKVASFGKLPDIRAGELVEVTGVIPLMGSGSAGVAGEADPILQIAGLDPTVVASTSVTYNQVQDGIASGSMYVWEDGRVIKLVGCRATLTGNLAVSETYGKLSVSIKGHLKEDPTDEAYPSFTYDDVVPPKIANLSGLDLSGFAPDVAAISFDLGNELTSPDSMRHADGYGELTITDSDVTGSFDPMDTVVAEQPWIADYRAGNTKTFTTGVIGSTAGNRVEVDFGNINYREMSPGERSGNKSNSIGFHAEDGVTITFT